MNILTVGFNGDGNKGFEPGHDNLRNWFRHLPHRVPLNLLDLDSTDSSSSATSNVAVEYQYQYHIFDLSTEVTSVLENYITNKLHHDVNDSTQCHNW